MALAKEAYVKIVKKSKVFVCLFVIFLVTVVI